MLFEEMKQRFQTSYLLTYRLNQDVLENFFGIIRSKGGLHDHPDTLEFKYRLRSYVLGQNEGSLSECCNTEIDDTPDLPKENLSAQYLSKLCSEDNTSGHEEESEFNDLVYDGLENIGGYICHKLNLVSESNSIHLPSTSRSYTWTDHLSEGGLVKPTPELMEHFEKLENIFLEFNGGSTLKCCKNYLKTLLQLSQNVNCDDAVKILFLGVGCILE